MVPRSRTFFVLVLGLLALAAGAAFGAKGRTAAHTLYLDGDSLAVGTGWYLPTDLPGWTVHSTAVVSRHASAGVASIEARAREGLLERVVVVDLGTNDDPSAVTRFSSYVKTVVRVAGPNRCVVWSTINRPPYDGISYNGYNAVLRGLDIRYRNLHVFDWSRLAAANPEWFGSDGVHPNAAGYKARAAGLARIVRSC
jgi:lysophospholipase L1-like esterase